MLFLYLFLALIVAIPLFALIRLLVKRLSLAKRIRSACRIKHLDFFPTHRLWLFGTIKGNKADFLIATSDAVYSVKLIGVWSKRIAFNYIDECHYSIRNLVFQFSAAANKVPYEIREKKRFLFNYAIPDVCAGKRIIPIILMNPVSGQLTFSFEGTMKPLSNGDRVSEGWFYSGSGFINRLAML